MKRDTGGSKPPMPLDQTSRNWRGRMTNDKGDASPSTRARLAALAVIAAVVMPAAAQCGTPAASSPAAPCPAGEVRVYQSQVWVCVSR